MNKISTLLKTVSVLSLALIAGGWMLAMAMRSFALEVPAEAPGVLILVGLILFIATGFAYLFTHSHRDLK
ncbi:hypothetical protein VVR12_06740 [Rothia sp. LK2588]|uniref:hypothetical protein n=1 Tax=Rothia sp. LK2588 TaxID=3114369 RepID=UPI0034CE79B3